MPKEYWTEVLKLENSFESEQRYKHLEELYRDCWKNRSMLQEIDLVPDSNSCTPNRQINPKLKLPKLGTEKMKRRRISSDEQPKLLNKVIFRVRRNSVISNYSKKSSSLLYYQNKPCEKV